jgi:predicted unusual protein kinase regulating ubiquinone biosynthesis (AarF/ABC1/UbiB family)
MDILVFLVLILRCKYFDKTESIKSISEMLRNSSTVWQKFAQVLSYNEAFVDKELAVELQKMLTKCPVHDMEYSRKIINKSFHYKVKSLKLLGSGTIAQTYKGYDENSETDIVFKVLHPNVIEDAKEARDAYYKVRESIMFPKALITFCDLFFNGIVDQTNAKLEYKNGQKMKKIFGAKKNNLFVFPDMLDYSNQCIVMTYVKSRHVNLKNRGDFDVKDMIRFYESVAIFVSLNILHGFMHSDMHCGNYGMIKSDSGDIQIAIYDFGAVSDIRDTDLKFREEIVVGTNTFDINLTAESWFRDRPEHVPLVKKQYLVDDTKIEETYLVNFKRIVLYTIENKIILSQDNSKYLLMSEKFMPLMEILRGLYEFDSEFVDYRHEKGVKAFYVKYFNYDDVKILIDVL